MGNPHVNSHRETPWRLRIGTPHGDCQSGFHMGMKQHYARLQQRTMFVDRLLLSVDLPRWLVLRTCLRAMWALGQNCFGMARLLCVYNAGIMRKLDGLHETISIQDWLAKV